jgi:hypothetical protein
MRCWRTPGVCDVILTVGKSVHIRQEILGTSHYPP